MISVTRKSQLILASFCLYLSMVAVAVPARPGIGVMRQPDGSEIRLRLRGDEWCHWHEDEAGYAVMREPVSEAWVYANLNSDGEFEPTKLQVGKDDPSKSLAKGLRPVAMEERARAMRSAMRSQEDGQKRKTTTKGTLRNLVVLVQFPDLKFKYSKSDFERLYNETGYSVSGAYGSVKDYYNEVSYGQLNLESVVAGPVTVSKGYANYGENALDSQAVKDMVAEALALLDKQGFDFSQCDVDNDGEIDGIDIIHAGFGAEYNGNSQNYIWSHKWSLRSAVYYDGVRIFNYHTEAEIDGVESRPSSNKITPIGVICHETGHFLGLPDLYDTDYTSSGVGDFCIMAGGSWNGSGMRPAHMSAWCKVKLGWVTPTEITESGDYSLPRVEDNKTIYKLHGNFTSEKEYFLLENRQGFGFDADMPGSTRGMLIWHIDDARSNNTDDSHYWVDLEEASGTQHLQLSSNVGGDDSDYWRSTTKTSFSSTSTPNSSSYTGGSLGISISSISASGPTMTFHASTSIGSTIPLGTALDNATLMFTTGGDASWFGQSETASDGVSAAQSGVISDNKSSWLQTTVTGPGTLSFRWKVSSEEDCDVLRLIIDGTSAKVISGETDWQTVTTDLALGEHTIRWSYVKDYSVSEGSDCGWVDQVSWITTAGNDDSAKVTVPQGGGTVTSSAITLSTTTIYNRREIPNWITSITLNIGSSSMSLGGGGSFGNTTIGAVGTASYTVTATENTGPERTWTWNIRSQAGDILHTLVVTQPGAGGGGQELLPDLAIVPADDWPCGLYLSASPESYDDVDEFAVGDDIYFNACFGNVGAATAAVPFGVLHEILDENDTVVASWRYDNASAMESGALFCWFGTEWSALTGLPAGVYTLRCTVDPDDDVEEEDETNNVEEYAFEIVGTETVTVSFDGNGGTASSASETYTVGGVYGTLPTAIYVGHSFAGWYTARSGGVRVTETTTASADVTILYAHWTDQTQADVAIELTVPKTTVAYGEDLRIGYSLRNIGSAAASRIMAQVTARYADSSQEEILVTDSLDSLAAGASYGGGTIDIPAGKYKGKVDFSASVAVAWETPDSDTSNNTAGPISVTFLAQDIDEGTTYGPFGSDDNVVSDAVAPTLLVNAAVTVRGEPASRNDCVAAYRSDTGELCGLGKILGDDGRMSMVMNINAGVKVHFKLWTSVSGLEQPEVLDCDAASDITMPTPGTFLTGRTLSFASSTLLEISLSAAKWHQVSFNVMPAASSPSDVFAAVADKIGYVTSGSKYWSPVYGGTLTSIAVGAGYWVQTTVPNVTLAVSGTPDPLASISLKAGWNLIGYTPTTSAAVAKALATALSSGAITYVCYGSGIYPGTLVTMYPGNGYWVYATRAGTITYDAVSASVSAQTMERAPAVTYGPFGTENDITGGDAVAPTIIQGAQVLVDGVAATNGDCVAAYRTDDGRLCGLARVNGDEGRFSMVLYLNAGTIVQFKVWRSESGTENPVILEAADTWVAPSPGALPLTDVTIEVASGDTPPDNPDDPPDNPDDPPDNPDDPPDDGGVAITDAPWSDPGAFSASVARTYDGMIFNADGVFVGTIQVKTTQGVKKNGRITSTVSATVKTAEKSYTYSGATTATGEFVSNWNKKMVKASALEVTLGGDSMDGSWSGTSAVAMDHYIRGARYVASRFAPYVGTWTTTISDVDGNVGHLNFTVNAKGAVSVSGSYPDGKKAIGTAQMIVGEDSAWIPWVAKTPTGGSCRLVTRILQGRDVVVDEGEYDDEGGGVSQFETNDCVTQLTSEDGWEISVPWNPELGSADGIVGFVRAQAPVIDQSDFVADTTNYIGVAYSETVKVNASGYPVKFSAAKLPTGLSINATTGKISGTPVRAGTFTATIKATSVANAKWSDTVTKTFVIQKLPDWAIGTFNGSGTLSDGTTDGEYGDSAIFTLSVTSAGKLSGKIQFKGLSYTISASSFAEFVVGDSGGRFAAKAKNGAKTYDAEIAIAAPSGEGGLSEAGGIVVIGDRVVDFSGYKSLWGTADYKAFAKERLKGKKLTLKGEDFGLKSGESLKFSFDAAGNVKIAGKFVTGKKGTYSVSASTTICVTELYIDDDEEWSFTGDVLVYFPAKSGKKFGGFFRKVTVWSAEGFPLQAY